MFSFGWIKAFAWCLTACIFAWKRTATLAIRQRRMETNNSEQNRQFFVSYIYINIIIKDLLHSYCKRCLIFHTMQYASSTADPIWVSSSASLFLLFLLRDSGTQATSGLHHRGRSVTCTSIFTCHSTFVFNVNV